LGGWNLGMSTACKDKEAAFALMNFLSSPAISVEYSSTFSSRKSAAGNPKYADQNLKVFMEAINYGVPLQGSPMMNRITNIIYTQAQSVLSGVKNTQTALANAETEVNTILAD
jgi:ABC-type glycerol-3-phosphate transport system substrate-binding protein